MIVAKVSKMVNLELTTFSAKQEAAVCRPRWRRRRRHRRRRSICCWFVWLGNKTHSFFCWASFRFFQWNSWRFLSTVKSYFLHRTWANVDPTNQNKLMLSNGFCLCLKLKPFKGWCEILPRWKISVQKFTIVKILPNGLPRVLFHRYLIFKPCHCSTPSGQKIV